MTEHLVVTAMGTDRPGIVSKLARLASDCDCDIVDSRMAIFGNEFTLILMLSGSWSAITRIESNIPSLSAELELLTVVKRTSKYIQTNYATRLEISFTGKDERGTMKAITEFLAAKHVDVASLRSHAEEDNLSQQIQLTVNVPTQINLNELQKDIHSFAASISLVCEITQQTDIKK
ncbi:glycine cleavage system transcriptional repressor [Parashewanella spongiae]|uniref:Glycine cleavage system transcriptional repressor n=1 Tax=Parashewanella spongiae TaxID=342950 RepID=A0A3A6TTU4_9GAMM|nr:ACT domain-containing protein [Parashewanella spongiae]MCL1079055.1 glycine cleavage system transcriptional repressor [Parashewanella spongiae]RJY11413.1 glycine cleavage system transcriptional repressor [Parashewanella spongiae]